ncbi:MAG: polysaccharide biosynthesis protein [Proteobacteria bacterium]|nr:polysaccharide biosynthesis protein [Pseudomonadota bacterium]
MTPTTEKYRSRNTILRICIELVLLSLAFAVAFFVRLDLSFDTLWFKRMIMYLPFVVAAEYAALVLTGATKGAWRFVSLSDVYRIILALVLAQIPFVIERVVLGALSDSYVWALSGILPWGVLCMNPCFAVLGSVGIRVVHRMRYERSQNQTHVLPRQAEKLERTVVIGTGSGCKMILESIRLHPELGIEVVGFISDELTADGERVFGVPVLGKIGDLGRVAQQHEVTQAIISQSDADSENLNRILDSLSEVSIKTRIVPLMNDILSGAVDIGKMREISVEDLLHRDPIQLDKEEISKFLSGRRILISGAGGSIGSEMCRQVLAFEPSELVLLERCELFLYEIERELNQIKTDKTRIIPRLADICDESRMREIFEECKPEVIFHAAAYKHVPMLEYNPGEAIRNNVEGTACIANCAVEAGSDAFVMISTDKAVNPTSIMGTSKRIAELYIQAMSGLGKTRFCAVRFGNVLGSTGSVLPLFKSQIQSGGPLTVTHPEMVRYFMTIPEASQLVMQAATMGGNGEIFVLDMGRPVKIVDLARDLIRLSGKTEKDIPIVFSGVRPGEKLFEELGFNEEHMDRTGHPKIYVGKLQKVDLPTISAAIEQLKPYRDSQDNAAVRAAMHEIVPEMMEPAAI